MSDVVKGQGAYLMANKNLRTRISASVHRGGLIGAFWIANVIFSGDLDELRMKTEEKYAP